MTERYTPRERVALILNHQEADRVPLDIGSTAGSFTNTTFKMLKKHFGITSEDLVPRPDASAAYYNDDLLEALGSDFRHIFLMPPDSWSFEPDENGTTRSEWGMEKRKIEGLTEIVSAPLKDATVDDLASYPWPDPEDPGRVRGLKERIEHLYNNTDYALASRAVSHGFFELAWELRGMENFMVDMLVDREFAEALLDKTLEIQMGLYTALLKDAGPYLQVVETADDYGMQTGPLMSVELFRELIKPRRKKLNEHIKSLAPNCKVFHHTCGSVFDLLPDLMEAGVDILNPCQPLAAKMDSEGLKKEFGNKICFHGAIDEQAALPGTIEQLEAEIEKRIDALSPGGGYIVASTSNIQDDTPLENILFYIKKVKDYGVYR